MSSLKNSRSTKDDPQEWVNLLIDEIMWPDLELGRDDAGFEETVAQIQREQMLAYLDDTTAQTIWSSA